MSLLFNRDERRLRAGWRVLVFFVLFVVVSAAVVIGVTAVGAVLPTSTIPLATAGTFVLQGVVVVATIALVGRVVDRRRFSDFGLRLGGRWWSADLGFGLALGALLMSGIFVLELALGWITVTGTFESTGAIWAGIGGGIVLYLAVGIYEELLVRGYLLTNIAEGVTGYAGRIVAVGLAILLSSSLFGALHAANPGATVFSTLFVGIAGVWLALGYVLTGELAIPIGIHITWNAFQGLVFGFPVSGSAVGTNLIVVEQGGPTVWTGGAFGPEAGLIGLTAMLIGMGATVLWVWRTRRFVGLHPAVTTPDLRRTGD